MHPVPSIVRRPTIGLQRRHLPWDAGIQQWMRASVPRWRPGICATILSARRRVSTAGCRLVDDATFRPSATTRSYRTATALRIGHAGHPKRGPGAHPDRSLDRQCMGRPPSRGARPAGSSSRTRTSPRCTNPDAEGHDGSARRARPGRRQPARGLPSTVWSSSLLSVVYTVARATAGARPGPRPGGARAARTRRGTVDHAICER